MEILIESGKAEKNYWIDIWRYRELLYILSWRDVKVRYKQTVLGAAWSIIRPLLTTLILTFVFSRVAKLTGPQSVPYILLVFAAMLPWQFFANGLSEASGSLIGNSNLITKVYFPRIIIPASTIITSVIDFFVTLVILLVMMAWYGMLPPLQILLLPVLLIQVFIFTLGFSLWLTALNVKYRDFRYIIPFLIQIGLYLTPVGFSTDSVPVEWKSFYSLNPMVGIIDTFRWAILDTPFNTQSFFISMGVTLFAVWFGISYFRGVERSFADSI